MGRGRPILGDGDVLNILRRDLRQHAMQYPYLPDRLRRRSDGYRGHVHHPVRFIRHYPVNLGGRMTIQRTLWSPDTCECQIEYSWDDTVPQDQRTHTISKIVRACSIHSHHTLKENHFNDVLDENQSKNKAVGLLVKTFKKLDGGDSEIKWRFEIDRSIVLSHPLLTQVDKDTVNALPKPDIIKKVTVE